MKTLARLQRLPDEVLCGLVGLIDCNRSRANLKLASRIFYTHSQKYASDWHPIITIHEIACTKSLLAFLQRYRPQLTSMTVNTAYQLFKAARRDDVEHIILPCLRERLSELWLLEDRLPSDFPSLRQLTALRSLGIASLRVPQLPLALTQLTLYEVRAIPAAVRQLTALQQLSVDSANGLCHVPTQITYLDLSVNDTRGGLAGQLSALHSLAELELRCNKLFEFPDLAPLTALKDLTLECYDGLQLEQQAFVEISAQKLPAGLTKLNLELDAGALAPAALANLVRLQRLLLKGKSLVRSCSCVPPGLTHLQLSAGELQHVPAMLAGLNDLQTLSLMSGFSCSFEHIPGNVTSLLLSLCNRPGVPRALSRLTSLRSLCMQRCQLSLSGLEHLPPSLTSLELSSCGLTALPEGLRSLTSLQALRLFLCQHLRTGLQHLPTSLATLTLEQVGFINSFPQEMTALTKLRQLSVQSCGQLDSHSFRHLPASLQTVTLDGCGLQAVPPGLQRLTALRWLSLDRNLQLSSGFEFLPDSLEHLSLDFCGQLDSLPDCLKGRHGLSFSLWGRDWYGS